MKVKPQFHVDLPTNFDVAKQLVLFLASFRHPIDPKTAYDALAEHFGLDTKQRHVPRQTRSEPAWNNRVQTARKNLVEHGIMADNPHNGWSLTEVGRDVAERWRLGQTLSLEELGL